MTGQQDAVLRSQPRRDVRRVVDHILRDIEGDGTGGCVGDLTLLFCVRRLNSAPWSLPRRRGLESRDTELLVASRTRRGRRREILHRSSPWAAAGA